MLRNLSRFLFLVVLLAGCTLAPDYQRPELPVPATWSTGATAVAKTPAPLPWQTFYLDPGLRQVIALALENNRDLRIAALKIEKTRALYQIERAALFPEVDAAAFSLNQRQPADLSGSTGRVEIRRQYSAGLGISAYELDIFGRVQSLKDEALQEYLATSEARRSLQIALIAEVAGRYLSLAANREALDLARKTMAGRTEAYNLSQRRYNSGLTSALDLQQVQTTVDTARVDLARYTRLAAQDENALQFLVGTPVPAPLLPNSLPDEALVLQEPVAGLASETLLNRPDILRAEHHLQGVTAHIGAARAAFFPSISLTGTYGTGSVQLSGLFGSGSNTWSFLPQITVPIFDGGSNRAGLEAAQAEQKIAIAEYERAIQTAFREVADALAVRDTVTELLTAQASLAAANANIFTLADARYSKGIDNYLVVLDAQRSLYGAQQELIATRLLRMSNLVTLYKVLGGGAEAVVE
jgi:multidrug efflux system outer membrane protein